MTEESKKAISAFAYNTGNTIEKIMLEEIGTIKRTNELLQARILIFRRKLHGEMLAEFDKLFDITNKRV